MSLLCEKRRIGTTLKPQQELPVGYARNRSHNTIKIYIIPLAFYVYMYTGRKALQKPAAVYYKDAVKKRVAVPKSQSDSEKIFYIRYPSVGYG